MLATTAVALAALLAQEPRPDGVGQHGATIETLAEWGHVQSSTYDIPTRYADARAAMQAGPATTQATHPISGLRTLLPETGTVVGDVWQVEVAPVLPLLAQLHPGVTARLRHANPPAAAIERFGEAAARKRFIAPAVEGGRATLLAIDDERIDILFRVHVEFELIPAKMWLLPAQFEGHLVWDRKLDVPTSLHLRLPPRDTNWDINHHKGGADIGYLPLMHVVTAGAEPAGPEAEPARQLLREAFYPASKVHWRTLAEAFARAKSNGRMLHVMQLFGTLDDESC